MRQPIIYDEISLTKLQNQFEFVIEVLRVYNCRVSEILNATWENYHAGRFLILPGKKKSANIIIRDRILLEALEGLNPQKSGKVFPYLTYSSVYHYVKRKFGHQLERVRHKTNKKITHAFRYLNVEKVDNDEIIREILHHRSVRSGKFYK